MSSKQQSKNTSVQQTLSASVDQFQQSAFYFTSSLEPDFQNISAAIISYIDNDQNLSTHNVVDAWNDISHFTNMFKCISKVENKITNAEVCNLLNIIKDLNNIILFITSNPEITKTAAINNLWYGIYVVYIVSNKANIKNLLQILEKHDDNSPLDDNAQKLINSFIKTIKWCKINDSIFKATEVTTDLEEELKKTKQNMSLLTAQYNYLNKSISNHEYKIKQLNEELEATKLKLTDVDKYGIQDSYFTPLNFFISIGLISTATLIISLIYLNIKFKEANQYTKRR